MDNNNKNFCVWFLVLLVIVLGGFIFYDKVILLNTTTEDNNISDINTAKEENYNLTEAKKLVSSYINTACYNTFEENYNDNSKKALALNTISKDNLKSTDCQKIYKNNNLAELSDDATPNYFVKDTEGNELGICSGNAKVIPYENALKSYQNMFGKDAKLDKKSFNYALSSYDYIDSMNSFVILTTEGGCGTAEYAVYDVDSAKKTGNKLVVDVVYQYINENSGYRAKFGYNDYLKITETELATIKNNSTEFINKYKDKMNKYKFTFNYDTDHYYLESVIKTLY